METLVAKRLSASDNDSYMHKVYPNCCSKCGYPTKSEVNPNFELKKKHFDASYTYDGYLIVSQRFKDFCQKEGYENIIFHEFKQKGFYFFEALKICPLDYNRHKVQLIDLCPVCGKYAEVISPPSFVKPGFVVEPHSTYRSEDEFGSYNQKGVLTIVGLEAAKKMKEERFRGLYFRDIYK